MYKITSDGQTFVADVIQHIKVENGKYKPTIYIESDGFKAFKFPTTEAEEEQVLIFALPNHTLLGTEPTGTFEFEPDPTEQEIALQILSKIEAIL